MALGIALIFGTAGLPHILVRFYTVPSARAARKSVVWAMILIGSFYILTTFLGFGAATLVGKANIGVQSAGRLVPNQNLAAPLLAREVGGGAVPAFLPPVAVATTPPGGARPTHAPRPALPHDPSFPAGKRPQRAQRAPWL